MSWYVSAVINDMLHHIFSGCWWIAYTIFFKKPYRKKSGLVRSGDLGHHLT